jgi:hypothetical protein
VDELVDAPTRMGSIFSYKLRMHGLIRQRIKCLLAKSNTHGTSSDVYELNWSTRFMWIGHTK